MYLILEYEQDTKKDQTFKDDGTHPIFESENEAWGYVDDHDIYGKIEEYDRGEYQAYMNDEIDQIPEPLRILEW